MLQPQTLLQKSSYTVQDLLDIMALLRSPNGCPWDKEQTHATIRNNLIEETYEVVDAIDRQDLDALKEELGDLLLQVVFHTRMEEEQGNFDFDAVCDGICKKLILRHPHIFADTKVSGTGQVLENWDAIKKKEKGYQSVTQTLTSVPSALPALMRSEKVQGRAAKAGFDYTTLAMAFAQLKEEIAELEQAMSQEDLTSCQEELGDVLFSAVNVARFLKQNP